MADTLPEGLQQFDVTEAMVSKGIHMLLFKLQADGKPDTSKNILYGVSMGSISSSGETVDSEELQDQLIGGNYKAFLSGAIDPGDFTLNTNYTPKMGKLEINPVVDSFVIAPQFLLILATTNSADDKGNLKGFWASAVNYNGGREIKGDIGKIIGSSLKFKASGEPKVGFDEVGSIPKSLYNAVPEPQQQQGHTNFD
jgi:hypothetical protein